MGGDLFSYSHETSKIAMPRWRFDILHSIDLVEDIAIGHGYEDLGTGRSQSTNDRYSYT